MRKVLVILGLVVAVLVSMGVVMLASAGSARGLSLYHDPYYFVKRQVVWLAFALAVVFFTAKFDYHYWRTLPWLTILFYVGVAVLLAAVFLFPKVNGSHRWLRFGSMRLQPSELAKIATIVCVSVWLDRIGWRVELFWKGAFAPCCVFGLLAGLLILEPDFGSTMVVGVVGVVLMFLAGTRFRYLCLFGAAGVAGGIGVLMTNANRMARIAAWLKGSESAGTDPGTTSQAAYQLQQAIIAIRNGGVWGVGFNNSMQKQYYLPEAHTDFIFAIGAEELGLIFSLVMLALFIALFVCGIIISLRATDRLGRLLAFGMTFLLVFQAVFNMGVVTGCLPTKGLALPFISYGGTNLITALFAVGTLMNIGAQIARNRGRPFPRVEAQRI